MIAACEQAEQRLRAGRERALETRRALDKIWKRVALELKESDKKSKEVFSCLIARQREKQKEMHDWLESATKASREFSKKLREELKVDTSRIHNTSLVFRSFQMKPQSCFPYAPLFKLSAAQLTIGSTFIIFDTL